ncbi:hypothetical protein E2C01_041720 [Portunus trituberculatus]|uniref:Uncharacterized protein n=1 Tax=Portunus trituberculatus TaxID=210409 RepID=A0A5B7FRR9_PORTR|nr:hypothetical protein [Portunus trituberculatus]
MNDYTRVLREQEWSDTLSCSVEEIDSSVSPWSLGVLFVTGDVPHRVDSLPRIFKLLTWTVLTTATVARLSAK